MKDKVFVRIAADDNFGTASEEPRQFAEPYIRKDALLEWAKEREAETRDKAGTDDVACAYHDAIMDLIEKLNVI